MDLDQLLPVGADPAPYVAHQAHSPEQIPLEHQRVKAADALPRVAPVQHQVALDWGSQGVRPAKARAISRPMPDTPAVIRIRCSMSTSLPWCTLTVRPMEGSFRCPLTSMCPVLI